MDAQWAWEVVTGTSYAIPYFSITLLPAYLAQPGLYTLSLNGQCGMEGCPCEIQFTVDCPDPCPCTPDDIEAFRKHRDLLFAQRKRYEYGCNVIFFPTGLSDCESVEWFLKDTLGAPIGTSEGNDPFSYDFSESGTYTVICGND
ncbi:MAG: hypothetical protein IPN60_19315 [Saprospiraceae bacterium]|nr:hypothetical protein [Candidatus Opimibacter skivensis]